ncbi:MAG: hypothetical protein ACTHJL_07070 [Amnibacterium sp.]
MTMTTPIPIVSDHRAEPDVRLVPVPTGAGVSLADRLLMHVGLALLLASSRHASRPGRPARPARTVLPGHPVIETARPFC